MCRPCCLPAATLEARDADAAPHETTLLGTAMAKSTAAIPPPRNARYSSGVGANKLQHGRAPAARLQRHCWFWPGWRWGAGFAATVKNTAAVPLADVTASVTTGRPATENGAVAATERGKAATPDKETTLLGPHDEPRQIASFHDATENGADTAVKNQTLLRQTRRRSSDQRRGTVL